MQHILAELEAWAHEWNNHVQKAVHVEENQGKTTLVEKARQLARILAEMRRLIAEEKNQNGTNFAE